ncbi:MAG: hypothetical protein H7122_14205 [Chitinophagaceae bacterium]|nr:hypothetical protein [Chitinophagaceae bacterium]
MSMINRNNYEEYFLLYTDNELNAAERCAVEEFIQQHPDLKIELEMFQQSTLKAEPIVFHSKDLLLKNSSSRITESNYEEYFVLYGDDELTNEEKDGVEQFVYRNSQYQSEFELIQKARLQTDRHIVFPDKSILYRTEKEDEKVFVLRWWKIAAAAILFIFLSGLGWYIVSKDKTDAVAVKNTPEKTLELPVPEKSPQKQENITQTNPSVPAVSVTEPKRTLVAKERPSKIQVGREQKEASRQLLTDAQKEPENTKGRNIQIASTVTPKKPEVNIQKMETSNTIAIQNNREIVDKGVGLVEENPYARVASNDEIEILNTTVSKKNKLRGLFRKVSRVVEKTTNIEPGDGRGIRIANFEIALK